MYCEITGDKAEDWTSHYESATGKKKKRQSSQGGGTN